MTQPGPIPLAKDGYAAGSAVVSITINGTNLDKLDLPLTSQGTGGVNLALKMSPPVQLISLSMESNVKLLTITTAELETGETVDINQVL